MRYSRTDEKLRYYEEYLSVYHQYKEYVSVSHQYENISVFLISTRLSHSFSSVRKYLRTDEKHRYSRTDEKH
jgi:hypothetical protein